MLNHFMSKLADRCLPFFKLLRAATRYKWTEECQTTFNELKRCLSTPLLLASRKPSACLFVYLATSDETVATVLITKEERVQRPVCHISKVLQAGEINYTKTEKLVYALIIAAKKLCQYFQAHPITVLTNCPIKDML